MGLSTDLISQFVKTTNDKPDKNTETTVYGVIKISEITDDEGNKKTVKYLIIDGSTAEIPVAATVKAGDGDRVIATVKNHMAFVTGNISSPSVREDDTIDISKVDEINGKLNSLTAEDVDIKGRLDATEGSIENLEADTVEINETLNANSADIKDLKTNKIDATVVESTYATIEKLSAVTSAVYNFKAAYGEFSELTTNRLTANEAAIAGKLSAKDIEGKYANIDFSNINIAAIESLFTTSGVIKDIVVDNGKITGELVGVTISGDLIKGNTIVAEKLVVKGEDGLYYKLNTEGVTEESEEDQNEWNSLSGSVIAKKSITATKINVSDLVAFGATIGGFKIESNSIHSVNKDSVTNTTEGIYLDKEGQVAIGDASKFIKYYKVSEGVYKLEIVASDISLEAVGPSVGATINNMQADTESVDARLAMAESLIQQLSDSISMLVTDANGSSMMTQTDSGWTFNIKELNDSLFSVSSTLDELKNELGDANNVIDILNQAVADIGEKAAYIQMRLEGDQPCIELGTEISEYKLLITNTGIRIKQGSNVPMEITDKGVYGKKIIVEDELEQDGFVWKVRSNGNYGLVFKGVSS